MTITDQENIQEYRQPKETLTKAEEEAVKLILQKKEEIKKLLRENNLHEMDLNEYKRIKKIDEFMNSKLP